MPEPTPSASPAPELTRADLEPFLDGLINSQLENRDVAGAVVAVVKDGEPLLTRGFGYADFERKRPVIADQTLFRPGSISKLFTGVAVMQLVEQGKLELDRDVRDYLDFDIPRSFPEPITLRRILTHTAGFEESLRDLFGASERPMLLRDYLATHIPAQIFRPGMVPAYSNYATGLAGYIVQRTSGERFEDYVRDHILVPLGMNNSTFEQPLPKTLEPKMSNGYGAGSKAPRRFEVCNPPPAGALSTTAADMSRFMLALLNEGTLDGATILQPQTLQAMQSRQNELHPQLHAMGLSFMEYSQNEHTMWGHGGDTFQFHSDLWLIPGANVGFYISYNSAGNRPGSGRGEVLRALLGRYLPETKLPLRPPDQETVARGREVSGIYEYSRKSETNRLRFTSLVSQVRVSSDQQGVLAIEGAKNLRGQPKRWREAAPLLYEEIGGPDRIGFRRDDKGRIAQLLPNMPVSIGERMPFWRSKSLLLPLVGGSLALIVATLVFWPIAALVRKRQGRRLAPDGRAVLLHRVARLVCALIAGMVVAIAIPFSMVSADVGYLGPKSDPFLWTSTTLGWLACIGLLAVMASSARLWRTGGVGWWARAHSTLLAAAVLIFLVFAWQFHLLAPSVQF